MLSGKSVQNTTPCHQKRHQECTLKQLSMILRVFRLQKFFFTENVSIGTSVRLRNICERCPHTVHTNYKVSHATIFATVLHSVLLSCLIPGSVPGQLCSSSSLFFSLLSAHYWYPISMATFKAHRSKRTDDMRDFSSVRLHQIPLHERPHHHRPYRSIHQTCQGLCDSMSFWLVSFTPISCPQTWKTK